MEHRDPAARRRTLFWSLGVLLAMALLFALLVGPALIRKGSTSHAYQPPQPPRDQTEFSAVKAKQAPGLDLALALRGDPALAGWAKEEYGKICAACHGATGKGDAPAGVALKARNFTQDQGWVNGTRLTQIFRTLTKGTPKGMPPYDTYTPAQRLALAHQVQGFMTFPAPRPTAAEVAALDQEYSLSAGTREPGRVPVRVAMARLAEGATSVRLDLAALPADLRHLVGDAVRAGQTVAALRGRAPTQWPLAVQAGAPANGFHAGVGTLTGADWQRLAAALPAALHAVPAGGTATN